MKRIILLAMVAFMAMLVLAPMAMAQDTMMMEMTGAGQETGGGLPTSGGPAILLPAAALLVGSGILTYAILRRSGWRSPEELEEAAQRSTAEGEKMSDDIRWIRSYVLDEGGGSGGTVCIYQASSPEAIQRHAGNADEMLEPDGSPDTAHSLNPVPFVVTPTAVTLTGEGILADVAPTLLELLGIDQPPEMTGRSLLG